MALPLLSRAAIDDGAFVRLTSRGSGSPSVSDRSRDPEPVRAGVHTLMPERRPGAGEQYRFHINMDVCIGCKCCVVACNEQNGNPPDINWRRVAEVEGGRYPATRRAYVSMGCNHCADPTCLAGCPVDAYSKDDSTGIVRHNADTCIGCQYCTWTCSYGVPQFNPERGVVGKCDMCHGRLALGQAPACVSACPEGALSIEIVNVADWRVRAGQLNQPAGDGSLSTTRITTGEALARDARPVTTDVVAPAEPHWPLVAMTVLTQMAAGAFLAVALALSAGGSGRAVRAAALAALAVLTLGLGGATFHLGRPIHAYRAMRMWRRSWLSREVVLFGLFAKSAAALTALLWLDWPGGLAVAWVTAALGLAGVAASAFIYQVPSRPFWHSPRTFVHFFATVSLLGALAALVTGVPGSFAWRSVAAASGLAIFVQHLVLVRQLAASRQRELRGAFRLITHDLRTAGLLRLVLLFVGGIALPAVTSAPVALVSALLLGTASELIARYLFFALAIPAHMAAPYFPLTREAA